MQKRCDELAAVAEAERRISDLHRQLGELGDIGRIRREVETLKAQVEASAQRAAEVDDFVAETNRTLTRVLEQEAAARKGIEAVKRAAETLDKMVHEAQANSGECKHQAAQSREELDAVGLRWQELQKEFGIVEAATRSVMKDLQRALQEAREELNRREPEPERHDAAGAAVVASLDPPNVGVVPADEFAL